MVPNRFVLLAVDSLQRVQILRALLEDEGIPAHIDSEEAHCIMPLDFQGAISARLMVPETWIVEARQIAHRAEPPKEEEDPEVEARRIGWKAIFSFSFPPYGLLALADAIRWLKYHPGMPGRRFVKAAIIVALLALILTAGLFFF